MSERTICPLPSVDVDDGFARALQPEVVGGAVQRCLATDARLLGLEPRYVRWKGRDGALIGFAAQVEHDGERHDTFVTVRTAPRDRLTTEFERIEHRADRVHLGLRGCALVDGEDMLLLAYPIDRIVRELRHLVRASKVRGLVLDHCPDWLVDGERITKRYSRGAPVRYKPERRAVVRWHVGLMDEDGVFLRARSLWLRVHAAPAAPAARAATDAARAAGVRAPKALAIPHDRLLIEDHVDGVPWRPGDEAARDVDGVAEAVARLHAGEPVSSLPTHGVVAELDAALRCADDLRRLDDALGRRALLLADRLSAQVPAQSHAVLSHGDLHPEQVLLGDEVGLVDFDRACRAPRAHDLGTLRAHLAVADVDPAQWRRFHEVYEAKHGPVDRAELDWWTATAMLRLAIGPFRRLQADWPAAAARVLAAVEVLGRGEAGGGVA